MFFQRTGCLFQFVQGLLNLIIYLRFNRSLSKHRLTSPGATIVVVAGLVGLQAIGYGPGNDELEHLAALPRSSGSSGSDTPESCSISFLQLVASRMAPWLGAFSTRFSMSSSYQPTAELLQACGFTRFASPPGQVRYSRPSACGQETLVLYHDDELTLLEVVNGQMLYCFQGRLQSEAEFRVLLRQVNWPAESPPSL